MAKTYMIGNWKMNQDLSEIDLFFKELDVAEGNFWIAPQSLHLAKCLDHAKNTVLKIGAQNCSNALKGAYTGEISPIALKELGCHFVILGHSERRALYKESDDFINEKCHNALNSGLIPVLCIGETLIEREDDKTLEVVLGQLRSGLKDITIKSEDDIIIAYEPVWAIGTGVTATPEQAEEVHSSIRSTLEELYPTMGSKISILYGGSVKPTNVKELVSMPNINGGLVGGASLKASDFNILCQNTK